MLPTVTFLSFSGVVAFLSFSRVFHIVYEKGKKLEVSSLKLKLPETIIWILFSWMI